MRLMPISTVPEDAILGRDIQSGRADGMPLLRAGQCLTMRYLKRLQGAGIHAVYVEDELSEGIVPEQLITAETRRQATRAVAEAYSGASESILRGRPLPAGTTKRMTAVVEQILAEVSSFDGAALALVDMAGADAYTFQHSIDVTTLGLLLGQRLFRERGWRDFRGQRQFNRIDERLVMLGMGLLLHDIGKLAIPLEVLQKPGRLDPEEWNLVRQHPQLGIDLLGQGDWSPLVHAVVLRHHERWDGSGYPNGKHGEQIHEMARIAAVADVYDAVTSARVYSPARPPHVGVRVIMEGAGKEFDPDLVDVFSRVVPPFPPGSEITLADGRRGIVSSVPEEDPHRPTVRIAEPGGGHYEVALDQDPSLGIEGWAPLRPPAPVSVVA